MYLTSNDTWQAILRDSWHRFRPTILNIDFLQTYSKIVVVLSYTKIKFKHGIESAKTCIKDILTRLNNCGMNCNPGVAYSSDQDMCIFQQLQSSQCQNGSLQQYFDCLNPKEALIFNPTITKPYFHQVVKNPTIEEEKIITETHDFIGSLGGSLGMFFGFSLISWIFTWIDKIFEHFDR